MFRVCSIAVGVAMKLHGLGRFGLAFGLALAASPALAQQKSASPPVVVEAVPIGVATKPVSFARAVVTMNRGQVVGTQNVGVACISRGNLTWRGGKVDVSSDQLDAVFQEEVESAGFKVDGKSDNLFEEASASGEYAVAGNITNLQVKLCTPYNGFGNFSWKGRGAMSVEWQIYSRLEKKIVARVRTTGEFEQKTVTDEANTLLLENAFGENVRKLVVSTEFRSTFIGEDKPAPEKIAARSQEVLNIANVTTSALPLSDAIGSVVAIFTGDGHGSGFLISQDGYLLTNNHVVGATKFVKVRWSDGFETLGEVIRSEKGRDVALVKTDPRGRQPLMLRTDGVQPGENVFAIGARLTRNTRTP